MKIIGSLIYRFGSFLLFVANKYFLNTIDSVHSSVPLSEQEHVRKAWAEDGGNKILRFDYDLKPSSLVMDLGGYEGQWASDIHSRFQCGVLVFEPIQRFSDEIKNRFIKNKKISVYQYGLGPLDARMNICVDGNASSLFKTGGNVEKISIVSFRRFIEENSIKNIDLLKINIEGGEYDLLDYLIDQGLIAQIDNIQVQFHRFVPDAEIRRKTIQLRLVKSHHLTYEYPFIWENWRRRFVDKK